MFRSLQVRIPLLAVGVVAVSLAVAVFVVFQLLLVDAERELDSDIRGEAERVREYLADNVPGALAGATASAPSTSELVETFEVLLSDEGQISEYMSVARIDGQVITTVHASNSLELLRDRRELPSLADSEPEGIVTVSTAEGRVRLLGFPLVADGGSEASVVVLGSIEEARRSASVALGRIAAAAGIGLALAGLLLAFTMRRALRPLQTLARAAREAELDDLGGRVELEHRGDEIGELAREFNRMLERLQQSVADHRQFMASVSHELRTPVTIARGHLELLLTSAAGTGSASEVAETAGLVADELKRMQRLVADLMALGRANDDDFVLPEPVSLRDFIDELQLRVVGLGTGQVVFEPVEDETILIDRDRLAQAMLNIVVNAELHASGHTAIVVGQTSNAGPMIGLFVRDDGSGVDDSVRESLFEPFVRAGSSEGSTGLGLSVVEAIARAHSGNVTLDTGPTGTTVTIKVPRAGKKA